MGKKKKFENKTVTKDIRNKKKKNKRYITH